jgi:hypothetical protein
MKREKGYDCEFHMIFHMIFPMKHPQTTYKISSATCSLMQLRGTEWIGYIGW